MLRMTLVRSGLLALSAWLGVLPVHAQTTAGEALEIHGDSAPDACLSAEQLSARIAHYGARTARARSLRVVLELAGSDAVELKIFRGDTLVSRRRFEQLPAACADRRDAIALSIALALEQTQRSDQAVESTPTAAERTGSAKASDQQSETDSSVSEETRAPAPQPAPAPDDDSASEPIVLGTLPSTTSHKRGGESGTNLALHLGARWIAEALPFAVWAGAFGIELQLSRELALEISALASLLGDTELAGGRARGRLMGLEAVGCRAFALGPLGLDACGGASAAACEVGGRGFPVARPDTTVLWASVLARAVLRWPREEFISVRVFVQVHVNVSRPELRVMGVREPLRAGWLGATGGLELRLALP